jgi:hypothetical protein
MDFGSDSVVAAQDLRGALADDDARSHCVSGYDAGHDRWVGDAKALYSIDFQITVNHRRRAVAD